MLLIIEVFVDSTKLEQKTKHMIELMHDFNEGIAHIKEVKLL